MESLLSLFVVGDGLLSLTASESFSLSGRQAGDAWKSPNLREVMQYKRIILW
jgi:hypothetical protein